MHLVQNQVVFCFLISSSSGELLSDAGQHLQGQCPSACVHTRTLCITSIFPSFGKPGLAASFAVDIRPLSSVYRGSKNKTLFQNLLAHYVFCDACWYVVNIGCC